MIAKALKKHTNLDVMVRELAGSLRDAIDDTDLADLEKNPEDAYIDLACRLILQMREKLTIVPVPSREDQINLENAAAAVRTFDTLTQWMKRDGGSYDTRMSPSGTVQMVMKAPTATKIFFGETVQDAYAQAAQAISFNDGTL